MLDVRVDGAKGRKSAGRAKVKASRFAGAIGRDSPS
jgi:hypothetical protein